MNFPDKAMIPLIPLPSRPVSNLSFVPNPKGFNSL